MKDPPLEGTPLFERGDAQTSHLFAPVRVAQLEDQPHFRGRALFTAVARPKELVDVETLERAEAFKKA